MFQVLPFLVLAVGVDNIFILVQAFERNPLQDEKSVEKYIGKILGKVGPSILLAGFSESACFLLGGYFFFQIKIEILESSYNETVIYRGFVRYAVH